MLVLIMALVMALTTAVFAVAPVEWLPPAALAPSFVVGVLPGVSGSDESRWSVGIGTGVAGAIPACVWVATHLGDISEGGRLVVIVVLTVIFASLAGGLAVVGQLVGEGVRAAARR